MPLAISPPSDNLGAELFSIFCKILFLRGYPLHWIGMGYFLGPSLPCPYQGISFERRTSRESIFQSLPPCPHQGTCDHQPHLGFGEEGVIEGVWEEEEGP